MKYDAVIIGSGLGGLQCAYILAKEGYNVCVLEKNPVAGGCLQTFRRHSTVFDTGMHYIGSMDDGQILNRFFRYFGLTGKLRLKRMDENGYDAVRFRDGEYLFPMGEERLKDTMLGYFPGEKNAILKYTGKLRDVSMTYKFDDPEGIRTSYMDFLKTGFDDFLNSITTNNTLKNVLLGLSPLYAGVKDKTPLYIPMIIHASYNSSAYRFIDGGSQIADLLTASIRASGGTILCNTEVTGMSFNRTTMSAVEVNGSESIEGRYFISNIHPKKFLSIAPDAPFRPAYRHRLSSIEETSGIFTLYLSMKKKTFPYMNRNFYVFRNCNVWECSSYNEKDWPKSYMMHISPSPDDQDYAVAITVNSFMKWSDVTAWENTTVGRRGESYNDFKNERAERLLEMVEADFPGIRSKIDTWYTSTPLTYRDYTGAWKGSIYGILKDFRDPLGTMIIPKTSIGNLFFTGQNINVHGVIGVTVCSILTCMELTGSPDLINKIRK
jgi:all-trans-retinol 13,14-reductase